MKSCTELIKVFNVIKIINVKNQELKKWGKKKKKTFKTAYQVGGKKNKLFILIKKNNSLFYLNPPQQSN